MNPTPGVRPAPQILTQLMQVIEKHFPHRPALLTVGRTGNFEAGWSCAPDGAPAPATPHHHHSATARLARQQQMAHLITIYARHPDASPGLVRTDAQFPKSVVFTVPGGPAPRRCPDDPEDGVPQ